jgi:CheY-like chemotaxis protein
MPNVLVFESDSKFAGELKGELEQRGCAVTVVDDASVGLQTASMDKPDLILLAIELPRMNGFSVCNKLKRDPALKEVPLIIMSSDSTEETFEQHRRLRTHAEDYVHKPIAFVDLLPRINAQLPLPEGGAAPVEAVDEDIVIDDDVAFESLAPPAESVEAAPAAQVDEEVDAFTESAFGNIVEAPPPPRSAPPEAAAEVAMPPEAASVAEAPPPQESAAPAPPISAAPPAEVARVSEAPLDIEPLELPPSRPPVAAPPKPVPSAPPAERAFTTSIPPRPSSGGIDQALRDENTRLAERTRDLEKELRESRTRASELEDQAQRAVSKDAEVQRLLRELDEVKAKAAAGGGAKAAGSAREFLDLREALNKKDKELLDLRDEITRKDKDVLGLRDANLQVEREKADLTDRMSELEKQTADAVRQADSARADKDQASKRADDFKRKLEKLQSELDAKTADTDALRQRFEAEIAALSQRLGEELDARAAAQAGFETQLREAADRAEQVRAFAVTAAEERGIERGKSEAQAEAGKLLADAAANSAKEREQAVLAREAELRDEHEGKITGIGRAHDEAIARLKAEHAQMLADEDRAALGRIQDLETQLVLKHETAMTQEQNAHAATRSELVDVRSELDALRQQKTQGDARIASLENDIAERNNELYSTQATLREREASLGAATEKLAALGADLSQAQTALAAERARLEAALSKWTEDRASLERAKDAMAAALAQMDEIEGRMLE